MCISKIFLLQLAKTSLPSTLTSPLSLLLGSTAVSACGQVDERGLGCEGQTEALASLGKVGTQMASWWRQVFRATQAARCCLTGHRKLKVQNLHGRQRCPRCLWGAQTRHQSVENSMQQIVNRVVNAGLDFLGVTVKWKFISTRNAWTVRWTGRCVHHNLLSRSWWER